MALCRAMSPTPNADEPQPESRRSRLKNLGKARRERADAAAESEANDWLRSLAVSESDLKISRQRPGADPDSPARPGGGPTVPGGRAGVPLRPELAPPDSTGTPKASGRDRAPARPAA